MFSIPGDKAPGPDGFSSQFFKDCWHIVGQEVYEAIKKVFLTGKILKQCNNTVLTLVPKVEVPETVLQFRPIACCNTIYKCLSKVICQRMSMILPEIISTSQGAFIKGRDIVGNILICQDLIKLYRRKSCSPRLLMKLDLQKAYDSIEWSFVEDMLNGLGFPERMVTILMQCVSTPSFSIALNGDVFGFFQGKRGLRQGDPLSPLLFTLCLEYLSRVLLVTQKHRSFRFHPLCKKVGLSHLCFADDLILFCKGEKGSVELLLHAFSLFSKASGLQMNREKSSFYCNGMALGLIQELEQATGMKRGSTPFKYLGVSVSPKRLSVLDCQCLVDQITVIRQIDSICKDFLWYGKTTRDSPVLVAWEKLCRPKKKGGLGFKNLLIWNQAAIAKDKVWRDYEPSINSSWSWRKICHTKNLMKPLLYDEAWRALQVLYTIRIGYSWLLPDCAEVPWFPWWINKWVVPKHGFIGWLMAQNRLLTQDRLQGMGIIHSNQCFLCGNVAENHSHLFFQCEYSKHCCKCVSDWCGINIPLQNCVQWWNSQRFRSLCKKRVVGVILAALIYHVWLSKNRCVELVLLRPEMLAWQIRNDVRLRLRSCKLSSKKVEAGSLAATFEELFGTGPVSTLVSALAAVVEDPSEEEGAPEETGGAKRAIEERKEHVVGATSVERAQTGSEAGTSGRRVSTRRRTPRPTRRTLQNVVRVVERPFIRHIESRGQKRRRAETVEDDADVASWDARQATVPRGLNLRAAPAWAESFDGSKFLLRLDRRSAP
ncbi:uncharacterized protein LOC141641138 [Silene latifolia]|uniref:uncharacterized protein LOC141641138 n=1 Tax=Silene latifolia TaxID=37657 RepID=UPI003D78A2B4